MSERPVSSGVCVKIGPLSSIFINLYSTVVAEERLNTVCVNGHDAAKIESVYRCPECQNEDKTTFLKGRKEDDGTYTVVTQEALDSLKATEDQKQQMVVTTHPLADVLFHTISGSSTYYVGPANAKNIKGFSQGQVDEGYALLADLIKANPDKALVTEFATRGVVNVWRFGVSGDTITLTQLVRPEALRQAPEKPATNVDASLVTLATQLLDATEIPFDPAAYTDTQKAARAALLAAAASGETPVQAAAPAAPSNVVSLEALLKAAVEQAAPAAKAPAKKRPVKAAS